MENKQITKVGQKEKVNPVDAFLSGIPANLKTFSPILVNQTKSIFSVVQDLKVNHLMETRSSETPSHLHNIPNLPLHPHHSSATNYISPSATPTSVHPPSSELVATPSPEC